MFRLVNGKERKIICFSIALGMLISIIGVKMIGISGTVILAAVIFMVPLVPELRARLQAAKSLPREMNRAEMPHVKVPHLEMPDLSLSEETKEEFSRDWLSNKAILIYFILFIISFMIGYVILD